MVVVKGCSVADHLVDIEQTPAFWNPSEEGVKHWPHQPSGDLYATGTEKVPTLSDVRQFVDGNLMQDLTYPLTRFGLVAEYVV
jgi:hypothetical protein